MGTTDEFVMDPENAEAAQIVGAESSVIYQFTASWCKPCKAIAPEVTKLAAQHEIVVLRIDVEDDANESLLTLSHLTGPAELTTAVSKMPTFVAVAQGKVLDRLTGTNEQQLAAFFARFSKSISDETGEEEEEEKTAEAPTQQDDSKTDDDEAPDDEVDDEEEEDEDSYFEEEPFGSAVMPNPNLLAGASFIKIGDAFVSMAALVHAHGIARDGAIMMPGGVADIETNLPPSEVASTINRFLQEELTPEEYIALVSNK